MKLVLIGNVGKLYSYLVNGKGCCTENEIFLTKDIYSAWALISGLTPDIIIVNCETVSIKANRIIIDMKAIYPNAVIVIIADKYHNYGNEGFENPGADFFFDKSMEIEPLIGFLVKIKRNKLVLEILKNKLEVLN